MKKIVASIATGIMIAGTAATSVSAEEYNVQKGDSLWDIANEYNTTVDDLMEINELETSLIHPNQTLFINETYMVEKGDTLYGIGNEFDVTVDDIKEWNDLESDLIVIGQELEIKGVNVTQKESHEAVNASHVSSSQPNQNKTSKQENKSTDEKTVSVTATAYTADCAGCSGITSTGIDLNANPNAKVIAVDPNVIPIGSEVYVEGYGYATAADTGSAIQGNRIDVYIPEKADAKNWGVREVKVTILK